MIEDNNGFINFPISNRMFNSDNSNKTFVYLVAFDTSDISNNPYILSNLRLNNPGEFISDDINFNRPSSNIDELINNRINECEIGNTYFPDNKTSIPLTTSICVGWISSSFYYRDGSSWFATFRDLTNEGIKLYYSIKKLHNNKEIRILTFNNI